MHEDRFDRVHLASTFPIIPFKQFHMHVYEIHTFANERGSARRGGSRKRIVHLVGMWDAGERGKKKQRIRKKKGRKLKEGERERAKSELPWDQPKRGREKERRNEISNFVPWQKSTLRLDGHPFPFPFSFCLSLSLRSAALYISPVGEGRASSPTKRERK